MSSLLDLVNNSEKIPFTGTNKIKQATIETKKKLLRERRQVECFSIVNRGRLWYDCLTDEQITELNVWYHEWLNVTETFVIPHRPDFLTDKLTEEEVTL